MAIYSCARITNNHSTLLMPDVDIKLADSSTNGIDWTKTYHKTLMTAFGRRISKWLYIEDDGE
ncbi:hypothetical protein BLOT_004422 [Blomia tropicalis]|nr:hypothetical protein BLOT_004422 [Blomia tropicalis]